MLKKNIQALKFLDGKYEEYFKMVEKEIDDFTKKEVKSINEEIKRSASVDEQLQILIKRLSFFVGELVEVVFNWAKEKVLESNRKLNIARDIEVENKELRKENEKHSDEISGCMSTIPGLMNSISVLTNRLKNSEEKVTELRKWVDTLKKKNSDEVVAALTDRLEKVVVKWKNEVAEWKDEVAKLKDENEGLKNEIDSLLLGFATLTNKLENSEKKVATLEHDNGILKKKVATLEHDNGILTNRLENSEKKVATLTNRLEKSEEKVATLDRENRILKNGVATLHRENSILKNEVAGFKNEVDTLKKSFSIMKNAILTRDFSLMKKEVSTCSTVQSKPKKKKEFCEYCKKVDEDLKVCTKCKTVKYCSVECQKQDWKKHRVHCKKIFRQNFRNKK